MKDLKNILSVALLATTVAFTSCDKDDTKDDKDPDPVFSCVEGEDVSAQYADLKGLTDEDGDGYMDRIYIFSGSTSNPQWNFSKTLDADENGFFDDYTFETMIKVTDNTAIGDASIAEGRDAKGATIFDYDAFEVYIVEGTKGDFAIKYNVYGSEVDDEGVKSFVVKGTMLADMEGLKKNEWAHVSISRSGSDNRAKLYVNGKLAGESTDDAFKLVAADSYLGLNYMARAGRNINFFAGGIDNVRVSTIDRYTAEFDQLCRRDDYEFDPYTLVQLNFNNKAQDGFTDNSSREYVKLEVISNGDYGFFVKAYPDTFEWKY